MRVHETAGDWNRLVSEFFSEGRRHSGERCPAIDEGRDRLSGLGRMMALRLEQGMADAAADDQDNPGDRDPENDAGRPKPAEPLYARLDLLEDPFRQAEVAHFANMTRHRRLAYPDSPPGD